MTVENSFIDNIKDYFSFRLEKNQLNVILISSIGFFIWFYGFAFFGPVMLDYLISLNTLTIEKGMVMQLFLIFMALSSAVTGYVINKTQKKQIFQRIAAILGSALTFSLYMLTDIVTIFPVSIILGISTGMYLTSWGTSFADYTAPEDRGRIMAIVIAISIPLGYLFHILKTVIPIKYEILVSGGLLLSTLFVFILKPVDIEIKERDARRSRGMGTKQTVLYSIPFFLFYIVVGVLLSIVFPTIQNSVPNTVFYLSLSIPTLLGALFGGEMLDSRGRKFPLIVGLALTGLSLAILGVLDITYAFYPLIPLAIGFSIVSSTGFVVWGDIAPMKNRGLYYGLGIGLLAFAVLVGLGSTGTVFGSVSESKMKSYLFSSAVALFLCIPPIIASEDSLPKELIEKRQLEEHIKKARDRTVKR